MGSGTSKKNSSNSSSQRSQESLQRPSLDNGKIVVRAAGSIENLSKRTTSFRDNLDGFSKKDLTFGRCYGRGAYGKVVAVKRKGKKSEPWYAAKILDKKLSAKAQPDLKQILMEVNILVKVQSKFIANLHGGFCDKDSVYLILDLLLAGSLEGHLKIMGDQTESNARFYISNIFAALEHLHSHRVIHRDLKPDNIVMCDNGYLKLIDFGASYMGTDKNKSCSLRSGTIPYMAPEIFCKSPRHNHTVDFYATGVILFQILYKRVPYERGLKQVAPIIEKAKSDKSAEVPPGYAVKFEELAASKEIPSEECQNMVHRLMEIRPWARLGSEGGVKEIFEHSFYKDYDFQSIMNQTVVAPYIPDIQGGAINSQHEDCLDLFGKDDEAAPLTPEQEAIYFELANTLSKFDSDIQKYHTVR